MIEPLSQSDRANFKSCFQTDRHPSQGELFLLAPTFVLGERKHHEDAIGAPSTGRRNNVSGRPRLWKTLSGMTARNFEACGQV